MGNRRAERALRLQQLTTHRVNQLVFLSTTDWTRSFMGHAHDKRFFLNHLHKPLGVLGSTLGSSGYGYSHVRMPGPLLRPHGSLSIWPITTLFSFVRRCLVGGWPKIYTRPSFKMTSRDFSSKLLRICFVDPRSSLSTLASTFRLSHLKSLFTVPEQSQMIDHRRVDDRGPDFNLVGLEVYKYDHANGRRSHHCVMVCSIRGTGIMQVEAENFASFSHHKPRDQPCYHASLMSRRIREFQMGQIDKDGNPFNTFL